MKMNCYIIQSTQKVDYINFLDEDQHELTITLDPGIMKHYYCPRSRTEVTFQKQLHVAQKLKECFVPPKSLYLLSLYCEVVVQPLAQHIDDEQWYQFIDLIGYSSMSL